MSSLRIKLPPQKLPLPSVQEPMEEQSKRPRKIPKRYQQSPDGESAVNEPTSRPSMSRTSTASSSKPRRPNTAEPMFASTLDTEVDILNEGVEERPESDGLRSDYSPKPFTALAVSDHTKPRKSTVRPDTEAPLHRRKPRKVVISESEEDEYMDVPQEVLPEPEEDDEEYLSPEERSISKASKGKGKAVPGKVGQGPKSTKRKAKLDPEESLTPSADKKGSAKSSVISKKRLKTSAKADELVVDVVGGATAAPDFPPSSPVLSKQDSPAPTVPKRPKLPTIKKTKVSGTPASTTATSSAPIKKPPLEIGPSNKEGSRKNLILGNTDIDLSNKSIYQELFSKTGGSDGIPPRRAKEEERRKELNRLRDEARLKRSAETVHFFDLQAQFDKISRFEERLRAERSSALYPNFLAAKWREVYERDRRKPKEWNESGGAENVREEGEVG